MRSLSGSVPVSVFALAGSSSRPRAPGCALLIARSPAHSFARCPSEMDDSKSEVLPAKGSASLLSATFNACNVLIGEPAAR